MRQAMAGMLARSVVVLANSARKLQSLQLRITAGEAKDGMEHFEPYGITSCPLEGAEALAAFIGDRSHGVVLVVSDRRYRLQGLEAGEVALYTDEGDVVHLKRGRVIEVKTATLKISADTAVEFDTPVIRTTGRIESAGDQVAGGVSQINHPHEGVMPGPGQSGKPVGGGG